MLTYTGVAHDGHFGWRREVELGVWKILQVGQTKDFKKARAATEFLEDNDLLDTDNLPTVLTTASKLFQLTSPIALFGIWTLKRLLPLCCQIYHQSLTLYHQKHVLLNTPLVICGRAFDWFLSEHFKKWICALQIPNIIIIIIIIFIIITCIIKLVFHSFNSAEKENVTSMRFSNLPPIIIRIIFINNIIKNINNNLI